MKRKEQIAFVRDLSRNVTKDLIAKSIAWPKEWDGHELRQLLAIAYKDSATVSVIVREPKSKRAREFHNWHVITN